MRACGRCGHDNADHLAYCCACGRRMDKSTGVLPMAPPDALRSARSAIGSGREGQPAPTAFAATVALSHAPRQTPSGPPGLPHAGIIARAFDALRYVFVYVRHRLDAEDRKRALVEERDGAERLVQAALTELGRIVLHQGTETPELVEPIAAVARAEARRQAAIVDLAAAEKFQAAEDLRLGREQVTAETEWTACQLGAGQVDNQLRQLDDQRRGIDAEIVLHADHPQTGDADRRNTDRPALADKRARLDQEYGHLRERAAALRASTIAARAKLDQAIAARRQAATAITAGLAGPARERANAEKQIGEATLQIGRLALHLRVPLPAALPGYARVDRLQETITDRDRQIASVEGTIGRYDIRKLAAGLGLLTAILGALGASLWALLR